uniref:Methyltransferase n=1 Tax=Aegilops tauschii TaxID=37682 RepID=M8BUM9_AEGTA
MEHRERHCPAPPPRCLVRMPAGYRLPVPWPRSRDMIWYNNVPHPKLVEYKKDQNWVTKSGDYLVFPGGGTQFKDGVARYIQFVEQIMPTIQWGTHTRTVLDVGCGVASFGGYLLDRNVITMSLAPKDEHEAQIQFALERGIPAFLGVIGTQKLPFPDNAFDVVHCARCRVHWYAPLDSCILPSAVSSSDETSNSPLLWPERLIRYASVPDDSATIEKFDADTKYWKQVISEVCYNDFPVNWSSVRNVMDMNAGYGGFAAALVDKPLWVMNVVPIGQSDTLPVIFSRGLIGVYHDWCESFNTYPRTYDVLHMSDLLGSLTKRCDILEVAAEIDRILRPGRWLVLKDTMDMIKKMRPVLRSLHYETVIVKRQFLVGKKTFWRPRR